MSEKKRRVTGVGPMSEHKRVNSIARRMGRSWTRRLLFVFIIIDVVVLALAVLGFCYANEITLVGRIDPELQRWFEVDRQKDVRDMVLSLRYLVVDDGGAKYTVKLGDYIRLLIPFFSALLITEGIILMMQSGAGRRSANRVLRPLNQMTRTAQQLSKDTFDATRFESLEHAIEKVSPSMPGARVRTGDKELKGLESAINDLLLRMHEAYKEQLRFVSDASHELRTPIAVIQGYSSMLERWGKNDEHILDESIQAIKSEAEHMNKLVEQLLFLARGDSGRTELSLEKFNLTDLIREVYDEYQMIDEKHQYQFQAPDEVMCVADQALLKQVARVLTDNAIKYTPEGGIIMLRVLPGSAKFQVQDTGIGISQQDVPRIFERFFRSDPARGRATGGTGLGLSIAKWIVERHSGYFEVLSRQGIGTRITVVLPERELPKVEEAVEKV